jgi:hypothetical protein
VKRKSAAGREKHMNSEEFDREFDLEAVIRGIESNPQLQEVLRRIGSDFDDNGIPYWEKKENE